MDPDFKLVHTTSEYITQARQVGSEGGAVCVEEWPIETEKGKTTLLVFHTNQSLSGVAGPIDRDERAEMKAVGAEQELWVPQRVRDYADDKAAVAKAREASLVESEDEE